MHRFLLGLLMLASATALAGTVDAERLRRSLDAAEAALSIDARVFEAKSDRERIQAHPVGFDAFAADYGNYYAPAIEAARGNEEIVRSVREHQAQVRQCHQLLEWRPARSESQRVAAFEGCRSEVQGRRAFVDILLQELTTPRANDPR